MILFEIHERWNHNDEINEIFGPYESREEAEDALNDYEFDHQDDPVYFEIYEYEER